MEALVQKTRPQLNDVDPALLQVLDSKGVTIPGYSNQQNRRYKVNFFHRQPYLAGGHNTIGFFDGSAIDATNANADQDSNFRTGTLNVNEAFLLQKIRVEFWPGFNHRTGAFVGASALVAHDATASGTVPPAILYADAVKRILLSGRLKLNYANTEEWLAGSIGLHDYPQGSSPWFDMGIAADGAAAVRNVISIDVRNGWPDDRNANELGGILIGPNMPFRAFIDWPTAIALGSGAAGTVAGTLDVRLEGYKYVRGNP